MASRDYARFRRAIAASALVLLLQGCSSLSNFTGGGREETPYGDYLAARYASAIHDSKDAEKYFDKALAADPKNPVVLERAFMVSLNAGDMGRAVRLARKLVEVSPDHRMARLVLSLDDIKDGDYADAQKQIGSAEAGVFVALVGSLTQSWAAAGDGNKELALSKLKAFEGKPAFDLFRAYHKALILDVLGDAKGAEESYVSAMDASGGTSIRIVQSYASFLSRQGRMKDAREVLDQYAAISPDHPLVLAAIAQLKTGEPMKPLVSTAAEGVAEALYGLGSALAQDSGNELATLYLQLAIWMRPDFSVAHTLLADNYEQKKRWADAIEAYSHVTKDSPLYQNARIQTALDLDRLDKQPEAIAVLRELSAEEPKALEPMVALGDIYRGKERYAEAAAEYSHAISIAGTPAPSHWSLYYARGICNERLGKWSDAERDLKVALKLSGDHPLVLNYLGYSWIEQGAHLKEALAMIEKAVELRPTDGFIVDSLGWAQYRLGDYARAVQVLQRAVELEPDDSTINDHLGDAFWKVGRKIEARFQWSHALEMKPEKDRIEIIKTKLEFGLEAGEAAQHRQPPAAPRGS